MKKLYIFLIFIGLIITAVIFYFSKNITYKSSNSISNLTATTTPPVPETTYPVVEGATSTIEPSTTVTTPQIPQSIASIVQYIQGWDKYLFFPVNKDNALDKTYNPPSLVNLGANGISAASSSYELRKEVISDLKKMFTDAKAAGVPLLVTSPYRSYDNQVSTFNYWKNLELQKGLSEQQAEIEANKSSAYPGHSEHQLGTTADVISVSDTTFDNTPTNLKAWKWMSENIEKYGFVLSYPNGKEDKTGYIYEPWHIRWVGHYVAQAIKDTDYENPANSNTSTSYIKQIWDYLNNPAMD